MKISKILIVSAATLSLAACRVHIHSYGETWKSDGSSHWHECECGEKSDKADHLDVNADGKCDVCNREMEIPTPTGAKVTEAQFNTAFSLEGLNNVTITTSSGSFSQTCEADGTKEFNVNLKPYDFYLSSEDGIMYEYKQEDSEWVKNQVDGTTYARQDMIGMFGNVYNQLTFDKSSNSYKGTNISIEGIVRYSEVEYRFENLKVVAIHAVGATGSAAGQSMTVNFTKYGQTFVSLPQVKPLGPTVDVTFKGYNCSYIGNEQYHVGEVVTFQLKPNDGYAYPKHINVLGMDDWEYNNETGLVKGTVTQEVLVSARSYELGVNYYISHVIENETYFKNDIKYTYDEDTRTVTVEHDRFQNGEEQPYWVYYEIYRYNENHQLIYSSSDQNGPETRLEYIYNEKGLLTNINVTNNTSGSFKPFAYETYEYDELGRMIKDDFKYTDDNNDFYCIYTYGEDYFEERWHCIENDVDVLEGFNRVYTSFDYDKGTKKITCVEYLVEDGVETSIETYSYYDVYDIKTGNLIAKGDDEPFEERYIYNANNDLLRQESTFHNEDRINLQSYYDEDGLLSKVDYFYDESDAETPDYVEEFKYNDEGLVTHIGEAISNPSFTTEITYQDLGDIDWVPSEMIEGITIGDYSYCFRVEESINF